MLRPHVKTLLALLLCFLLGVTLSCGGDGGSGGDDDTDDPKPGDGANECVDLDADGRGENCDDGPDCDDTDDSRFEDCDKCFDIDVGCECEPGTAAVKCKVSAKDLNEGAMLCKNGMRYCRDGKWTICQGIVSFQGSTASP